MLPPHRQPYPQGQYSHGLLCGDVGERRRMRPKHSFPPGIAPHCPRSLQTGWGLPESLWVAIRERGVSPFLHGGIV